MWLIFCSVYAAALICIALRLGWYMLTKLDQFDWRYNTGDIWFTWIFFSLFWPINLFNLKLLLNPKDLFTNSLFDFAGQDRRQAELWNNPPPCTSRICYRQTYSRYDETFGEFIFSADLMEKKLAGSLSEEQRQLNNDTSAVFLWLQQRDQESQAVSDLPSDWHQFKYMADYLVRSSEYESVRCLACDRELSPDELIVNDDKGRPGWNFFRINCPQGHPLLVVENMHILVR